MTEPFPLPEPEPATADRQLPDAAASLRPDARGTAVEIIGQSWTFADYPPDLSPVWDSLYDLAVISGEYDTGDLRVAALRLLLACHDLPTDDALGLVWLANPNDLAAAVSNAMTGAARPNTWTSWLRASCLANGLNPDRIPGPDLLDVVDTLVATGRAIPADKWISTAVGASGRAAILALAGK